MKQSNINTELDLSKLWIGLFILFDILLLIGYWMFKNQEVTVFLIEHPIVIFPYFIDKYGIIKVLLSIVFILSIIPIIIALPSTNTKKKDKLVRGTEVHEKDNFLEVAENLCITLIYQELKSSKNKLNNIKSKQLAREIYQRDKDSYIKIADIPVPRQFESNGFFFFGDPGTGKSQSIKRILKIIKPREDFRGIVFDRNGDMLRQFYNPDRGDIIYNPFDIRSFDWCHTYEKGVRVETIAESLIPPPLPTDSNPYFQRAAALLLGEIFRKTKTNRQVYNMLTKSNDEIRSDLEGTIASKQIQDDKLMGSVISTINNYCKFYNYLDSRQDRKISFFNWAYHDDPRWIFVTLRENDAAVLKPLHSMLFELMLKGLISNEERKLRTAVVVDELGALNRLESLDRLLSEGRKYKGCAILGTQTQAQLNKVYGKDNTSILQQGTLTKLILRCSDPDTANNMSRLIGKCEKLIHKVNISKTSASLSSPASKTKTTIPDHKESDAVLPSQIQKQPNFQGYLLLGWLTSKVTFEYRKFENIHPNFLDVNESQNAEANLTKSDPEEPKSSRDDNSLAS